MSRLKRLDVDGACYFVTMVTYNRQPILFILANDFRRTLERLSSAMGFACHGWVILPDHVHMVIEPRDNQLASIIKRLKLSVGYTYRNRIGIRKGRIWQPRYWDHAIRDERDMYRRLNYIVNNPFKHGYVTDAKGWKWMSVIGLDR